MGIYKDVATGAIISTQCELGGDWILCEEQKVEDIQEEAQEKNDKRKKSGRSKKVEE